MEWSIYNHLFYSERVKAYLLYSSLSNMLVELDKVAYEEILKIKKNPECINGNNEQYKFLFEKRFVVPSNKSETNKLVLTSLRQRFDPQRLSLTIAPTQACNFNCSYCYEENRNNESMSKEVEEAVIEFVRKNKTVKKLEVIWYGGEPTLAIGTIKSLSAEFQKITDNYGAFMVTNGYRLDKIADSIDELKISGLQITLDGTQDTHNQTRHLINGKDTYKKILSNLDIIVSKYNINISIRMNISTSNSKQYPILFKELKMRYGNKVNLYPAFVHNYNGGCQLGTCFDDYIQKASFLQKVFEEEGIYTKDIYPFRASKGCMMQQMNSFVIGPKGELYKCWHHLGIDNKKVGDVFDNQIITNFGLLSDIMLEGDVLHDNNCKSCVLFPSCSGGCTDNRNRNEDYCIPAKAMLEDFIDIRYVARKRYEDYIINNNKQ